MAIFYLIGTVLSLFLMIYAAGYLLIKAFWPGCFFLLSMTVFLLFANLAAVKTTKKQ